MRCALLSLVGLLGLSAAQNMVLDVNTPVELHNEVATPLTLTITNNEPFSADLSSVTAVFRKSGSKKDFLNLTQSISAEVGPQSREEVAYSRIFSLPVGKYDVLFAVSTKIGETSGVIYSEAVTSSTVDPEVAIWYPRLLAAVSVVLAFLSIVGFLAIEYAPGGRELYQSTMGSLSGASGSHKAQVKTPPKETRSSSDEWLPDRLRRSTRAKHSSS